MEDMHIVIVGHVDHGKSTIIGRLLADTDSLPTGKLEFVKETCRRNSKPFEYAFLLDALKDEQSQGITIDTARCFFKTARRNYIIIDAPGHTEFLKNMITGASRAEAALLVIDAAEGVRENSRRHGYMLSLLGIRQIAVLINKMDLAGYDQAVFDKIRTEYLDFLKKINIEPLCFIPVSGMKGDNIAQRSERTPWYPGKTVLETLDGFTAEKLPVEKAFRMPVQGIYKFTLAGDDRRIIAGTVESGRIQTGDEVIFFPSGKKSTVKSIEFFNKEPQTSVECGYAASFTLNEQIYIKRGEIAAISGQAPLRVTSRFRATLFWLGNQPMVKDRTYLLKLGTSKVEAVLERIIKVMDAADLAAVEKEQIERHKVAECIIRTEKAIAFDLVSEIVQTSRFVIVDEYEISGGGTILEALEDKQSPIREQVLLRNYKWIPSSITPEERAERYNQKSALIIITGTQSTDRKAVARALEKKLFQEGKLVYFLGIGNVLYGVDADIINIKDKNHVEHLRRLAEVSHIMLDSGIILIVTALELTDDDLDIFKTVIDEEKIIVVWLGDEAKINITSNLHISEDEPVQKTVERIKGLLQKEKIIFKF